MGAVRAAYLALVLGLAGGLGLATVVLSGGRAAAVTVAAALDLDDGADLDRRREAAVAVLTARCMASLGFDWLAIPDSAPSVPDASLDPVSWADRWGFGVSTMIDRSESTPLPDRNLEALARLPAAEQTAARSALHGSSVRPGCAELASTDVYGTRERAMAPIRAALEALDAEIAADSAALTALHAWAVCVAPVSDGLAAQRGSLAGALSRGFAARVDTVRHDPSGLATLQVEERSTAGVLARCEAAFVEARAKIAAPHEAAFVRRHRAELASIGAAIRAAEAAWPTSEPSPSR